MLDRGDAVVYKCRGLYKVEEIGTLDFLYSDSGKVYYSAAVDEEERNRFLHPAVDYGRRRRDDPASECGLCGHRIWCGPAVGQKRA